MRTDNYLIQSARTVFFHKVVDTVSNPGISRRKHHKKCVFGVFLNRTRIALAFEN